MKTLTRLLFVILISLTYLGAITYAQQTQPAASPRPSSSAQITQQRIAAGSRIFVAPMEGNLHTFISAEIIKKRLPVSIVTDETAAEYIINGASLAGEDRWYHTVFGGRDRNEGSIQVVRVSDRTVVWAGEAGDRSLLWGNLRRGGRRRIADRLVSRMRSDMF